jgi:tetratricopeptide (TPR) repeat protein
MAIWGPDTVEQRIDVATDMLEVANRSGSQEAELLAHDYRLYAFFELGDLKTVHAEFDATIRAAGEIKQPAYWWKTTAVEAMIALFEGRFEAAQTLIERALELGGRGHSYAAVAHALQTFALLWARGPLEAAEDTLARLAAEYPTYPVLSCALAALHADLGREPAARALFERLAADEFGGIHRDEEWLLATTLLAPVCSFLGDVERAAILYRLLAPFASRNGVGVPEFATGSVSRSLGTLARSVGRLQDSLRHFQDAIEANERMGARPWLAHARHDYARALHARDEPGDEEQAHELLAQARGAYRELGMDVWADRAALPERSRPARAQA